MGSVQSDIIPQAIESIAAAAGEVLVCFSGAALFALADRLRALVLPGTTIELQCPPHTEYDVIAKLIDDKHRVFESRNIPSETQVFFDRRHGFRLPDWAELPDPFGAACKLVWSRTAAFVRVRGTVMSVDDTGAADFVILRLAENPHLRLSLPKSIGIPSVGQRIALLGRHDFNFGIETPLLECPALFHHD